MSFQLRQQEPVTHGLRRLARKQLQASAAALDSSPGSADESLHQARKALKKSRAILDLIEEDAGTGLGHASKQARSVNKSLSSLRDAGVSLKTLEQLRKRTSGAHNGQVLSRVHRKLSARKRELVREARRDGAWQAAQRTLLELAKRSGRWRPADRGFSALSPGLRTTMRRGRKALTRARKTGRSSDFHEWRKALKALWYQLRLLEAGDARIRQDIRRLDRAQTWLGEDHDLAVLCGELSGDSDGAASDELTRVRAQAERRQRELRGKAVASAAPLFRRDADAYVKRLKLVWKRWRTR
jgi:CHAD domain-containing protein